MGGLSGSPERPPTKAYVPTPRQLESLAKARTRKNAKREQIPIPVQAERPIEDPDSGPIEQDLEVSSDPKPVVCDNKLVRSLTLLKSVANFFLIKNSHSCSCSC